MLVALAIGIVIDQGVVRVTDVFLLEQFFEDSIHPGTQNLRVTLISHRTEQNPINWYSKKL